MFTQNFLRNCRAVFAGCLLLFSQQMKADLVVTIAQVYPSPSSVCVQYGGIIVYAITVSNNGPTSLRSLEFTDTLASALNSNFNLATIHTAACGEFCITANAAGFYARSHSSLGTNESYTFTVGYKICTGLSDELTNTAVAQGTDCNGNSILGTATLVSCVNGCALTATVSPSYPVAVCLGNSITLRCSATQ